MIEIEKYSCNDGNEARARERYWYEFYEAKLNMVKPLITIEEHKNEAIERSKLYYQNNKEKVLNQMKQYEEKNLEKLKEYRKQYYLNNIEKIKNYNIKKYTCECGKTTTIKHKLRHETSKHHQQYLNITI